MIKNINEIIELRRKIHQHPELPFEEFCTTELIEKYLDQIGLKLQRFENLETGGFCDIGTGQNTILFRSDIDALPIVENDNNQFKSTISGVMHACGHDYHTAIGVGLLDYFGQNPISNNYMLRVVFQPGEEAAPGGAETVVDEDIWKGVKTVLAAHVVPGVSSGKVILSPGPVQASSTSIKIKLSGPGGHTSQPHNGIDLVYISSQYISQLQGSLRQIIDPRETLVFGFGSIQGGKSHNIYPQEIDLWGTVRTLDNQVLATIQKYINEFSTDFAKTTGIEIDVLFPTSCPATINNDKFFTQFMEFADQYSPEITVVKPAKSSLGADDFAHYTIRKPGLYLQVGAGGNGALHTGELELDEQFLVPAIEMLSGFITYLTEKK